MKPTKQAQRWLDEASTEVLERVLNGSDPEKEQNPAEYPLADRASFTGVGQVFLKDIRAELARRKTTA